MKRNNSQNEEDLTLYNLEQQVKKLEKQMEKYDNLPFKYWNPLNLLNHIWGFYLMQKREDHYFDDKFQELMKHVETYLRHYQKKKTREVNKGFEEIKAKLRLLENTYSPETTVNLAIDDTFQALKMDIENLFEIKVEVSKWEFEIEGEDKEKALASRYRRIFEDDTLRLLLGEEDLQIVTKHDSFAYDIPLKLLRMALKIKGE